jgi:hypothetical protein
LGDGDGFCGFEHGFFYGWWGQAWLIGLLHRAAISQ